MIKRVLLIGFIGLSLVSCAVMKQSAPPTGAPEIDLTSLEDGELPVRIEKEIEGFGPKRLPKKVRWYRVYWNGITVGDLYATLIPTEEGYGMRTIIRTRGLAKMISGWQSDAGATMEIKDDNYISTRFKTSFQLRNKIRKIELVYKDGKIIKETNNPPENRDKRPAVPEAQKIGTVDPLTSVMVARSMAKQAITNRQRNFAVLVYDGRRKTKLNYRVYGANKDGIIHTSFIEEPVAGYTNNEYKDMKKRKPEFHIYLSPKDLLPVYAKGDSLLGTAYVKMMKECVSLKECVQSGDVTEEAKATTSKKNKN